MDDDTAPVGSNPLPSVKDLASSDPSLRRAAFNKITTHLQTRHALSHTESLQLWKGLFYLLWMHDPRVPTSTPKLISEISSLVSTVPSEIRQALCEGFWETMAREWRGIDRARLDKYLSLVRMVLREQFEVIERGEDEVAVEQSTILGEWPLCADQRKVPDGLRYQLLDCWAEELITSGLVPDEAEEQNASQKKNHSEKVQGLMELVRDLRQNAPSKGIRTSAKEVLEQESLKPYIEGF